MMEYVKEDQIEYHVEQKTYEITVTASVMVEVEAGSYSEAVDKAVDKVSQWHVKDMFDVEGR